MDSVNSVVEVLSTLKLPAHDPLEWFFANKKTYGLPADASLVAAVLLVIAAIMFVQVFVFEFCLRRGVLLRAFAGAVVASCLAAAVFLLIVLLKSIAVFLLAFNAQKGALDLSQFFIQLGGASAVGFVAAAATFVMFGKALAVSFM